jgi:hypothetical protein
MVNCLSEDKDRFVRGRTDPRPSVEAFGLEATCPEAAFPIWTKAHERGAPVGLTP